MSVKNISRNRTMKTEKIKQLIERFYKGQTTLKEEQQLHEYFQHKDIPAEVQSEAAYFRYLAAKSEERTSDGFDPFYKIEAESGYQGASFSGPDNKALRWSLRVAAGFILLLIGFSAGQFLNNDSSISTRQVAALQQEVQQVKDALMYSADYQKASAGERLSAVKMSTGFAVGNRQLDQQIAEILIYTMNNDKSVNVRLAAAEALFQFRNEEHIKRALVNSLSQQKEPQMQLLLIDMLVQLKASGALNEMNKLLIDSDTREIVRERVKAGIAELKI